MRSPGHNRVPLWDTVRGKKLSGFASPMEKNLKRYLLEHPQCVLYDRQLAAQHKQRTAGAETAAGRMGDDDDDDADEAEGGAAGEGGDDSIPPELERIISSSPPSPSSGRSPHQPVAVQAIGSARPASNSSAKPASPAARSPPIRISAAQAEVPRSSPMAVQQQQQHASSGLPPLSTSLPTSAQPRLGCSPVQSPSSRMQAEFEALSMSPAAAASPPAGKTGSRKLSRRSASSSQRSLPKPILLQSAPTAATVAVAVHGDGMLAGLQLGRGRGAGGSKVKAEEASAQERARLLSGRGRAAQHAAVAPAASSSPSSSSYQPALSSSVPLTSSLQQLPAATKSLTVETHFHSQSPAPHPHHHPHPHHLHHHYAQLLSSSLSRSTTCSPRDSSSHSFLSTETMSGSLSASTLSSPQAASSHRKAKSASSFHLRPHPYGDRTPKQGQLMADASGGRLLEEDETPLEFRHSHDAAAYGGLGLSHSLPTHAPHLLASSYLAASYLSAQQADEADGDELLHCGDCGEAIRPQPRQHQQLQQQPQHFLAFEHGPPLAAAAHSQPQPRYPPSDAAVIYDSVPSSVSGMDLHHHPTSELSVMDDYGSVHGGHGVAVHGSLSRQFHRRVLADGSAQSAGSSPAAGVSASSARSVSSESTDNSNGSASALSQSDKRLAAYSRPPSPPPYAVAALSTPQLQHYAAFASHPGLVYARASLPPPPPHSTGLLQQHLRLDEQYAAASEHRLHSQQLHSAQAAAAHPQYLQQLQQRHSHQHHLYQLHPHQHEQPQAQPQHHPLQQAGHHDWQDDAAHAAVQQRSEWEESWQAHHSRHLHAGSAFMTVSPLPAGESDLSDAEFARHTPYADDKPAYGALEQSSSGLSGLSSLMLQQPTDLLDQFDFNTLH